MQELTKTHRRALSSGDVGTPNGRANISARRAPASAATASASSSARDGALRFVCGVDTSSPFANFKPMPMRLQRSLQQRLCRRVMQREWRPLLRKAAERKAKMRKLLEAFLGNDENDIVLTKVRICIGNWGGNLPTERTKPPPTCAPPLASRFVTPAILAPSAPPTLLRVAGV